MLNLLEKGDDMICDEFTLILSATNYTLLIRKMKKHARMISIMRSFSAGAIVLKIGVTIHGGEMPHVCYIFAR